MPTTPAAPWKHPLIWLAAVAGALLALGALVGALSPILSPFVLAVIFSYIGNPLVGWFAARGLSRSTGAVLAIGTFITAAVALVLVLLPMVQTELSMLISRLPSWMTTLEQRVLPWIAAHTGMNLRWDAQSLGKLISTHGGAAGGLAGNLLESLGTGGAALLGTLGTTLIAPVVMFYLLRDWPELSARVMHLVPRRWESRTADVLEDIDGVLAEFLRGQLAVMLSLALFYTFALWAVGMDYALPVGLITGLLVFVPYIGFGCGLALALLVSLQQGWPTWALVLGVFALGQVLESFVLTPRLIGERIGLNPVAVIFALMAFGQLFGFIGVLLALPASAVLLVALRELRAAYLSSDFYQGHDNA